MVRRQLLADPSLLFEALLPEVGEVQAAARAMEFEARTRDLALTDIE
jgi:hypothetical protein